jgi:hypothetical protein
MNKQGFHRSIKAILQTWIAVHYRTTGRKGSTNLVHQGKPEPHKPDSQLHSAAVWSMLSVGPRSIMKIPYGHASY